MEPRTLITRYPVDSALFSPLQLHPRTILGLGMNNSWRWLESHVGLSFPSFVREFHHGLVMVSLDIQYFGSGTIFDTPYLEVRARPATVRRKNMILQCACDFLDSNGQPFASTSGLGVLLRVSDTDASLSARPAQLDPRILERFLPQEVDPSSPPRPASLAVAELEASAGVALAEGTCGFQIYRHNCEIADQWSFIELPAFAGEGRERLSVQCPNKRIRDGIRKPLRRWMAEILRPMYLFDEGEVRTRAYDFEGRLIFLHELKNITQGQLVAKVVEEI